MYRRELCGARLNEDRMSTDYTSRESLDEDRQSTEVQKMIIGDSLNEERMST